MGYQTRFETGDMGSSANINLGGCTNEYADDEELQRAIKMSLQDAHKEGDEADSEDNEMNYARVHPSGVEAKPPTKSKQDLMRERREVTKNKFEEKRLRAA